MQYIYDKLGNIIGELNMYLTKEQVIIPGKKIALVVGHTAGSQGAYGNSGIGEWEFNDEFLHSLVLDRRIDDRHVYYILYRDSSISGYKNQMIALHSKMDKMDIDLSIEFHFNSVTDSSVNGNEVLYCSEAGSKIADILDECLDSLPNRDRGTKKIHIHERGGEFCCRGKSVALITEPFFAANQSKYVYDGSERQTLIQAYLDFFKRI